MLVINYGQQLARQVFEQISTISNSIILEKLIIEDKKKAILETKSTNADFKLWYDKCKLNKDGTRVAVV